MTDPKEVVVAFEAVKVAMRQTKDGVTITLAIHPNEKTNDLFTHWVGSRYQVAMVLLNDQDEPQGKTAKNAGDEAVSAAGMLVRQPEFLAWLYEQGRIIHSSEADALQYLYHACRIRTRKDLATNIEARRVFDGIRLQYSQSRTL